MDSLNTLTQINLNDLVASFGWENSLLLASALRRLFVGPARKFARQMGEFDQAVGQYGLTEASRRVLRDNYVRGVRVYGREQLPANGSLLFLSNHPGMADTLSLFAAINRPDLRIIALHRPFLASLTSTTRHLFFIEDDATQRMGVVRQVSLHLRQGGSALTFPAGKIEPDPSVYDGAMNSLNAWTDSAGVFLRFARDTQIVPVLVSGVIWDRTARHLLTRLKRTRQEREKLAAALQLLTILTRDARPTIVHVRFAKPISLDEVGVTDIQAIHRVVIERMRGLIATPPEGEGISAL